VCMCMENERERGYKMKIQCLKRTSIQELFFIVIFIKMEKDKIEKKREENYLLMMTFMIKKGRNFPDGAGIFISSCQKRMSC